ncbi:BPI fold-containing family B member 3-like [Heteronotia binoei]|uniref:BPI fold-containing family B member 3-like n=1 Tax=Heteronotia binoei TaxID=13085 RepID=UPI002931AEBE|nr:BPI fold-containing family B member 3-like [Heteronotia binoei]
MYRPLCITKKIIEQSLKVVDIVLPKVSLKLLEGVGVDLNIYTKVKIQGGKSLLGLLNLHVEVNITSRARMVQDKSGAPKLVIEQCKTHLGKIQVLTGLLPLNLGAVVSNLLNNLLPGVLCPVIDLVLNVLNTLLGTVNSICPFGMLGQLHYTLAGLPLFRGQHILLNLNLMITDPEGKTINLPPAQLPSLPVPVPGDHSSQLVLPGQLLTTLIGTLGSKGLLNMDITQQTLHGDVPMTTTALQSLVPELSLLRIPSLPLVVRIRLSGAPKVALQNGEASVTLPASIGVLARTRSGPMSVFAVDATIGLSGKIKVGSSKLSLSLSLKSLTLKLTSSEIGSFNVLALEGWFGNLIRSEYVPVVNGALEIGIPLPKLFNLKYDDAVVSVVQNALVVDVAPKLL